MTCLAKYYLSDRGSRGNRAERRITVQGGHQMTAPVGTASTGRLRLSLAQLRYVADLAGAPLPAEVTALADAAARYDGGTDCGLEDLVARGVVTRDAAGAVCAAEQVRDDLRLLGAPDVAVDVHGRIGQRTTVGSCAIHGANCVTVRVADDGGVELSRLPASRLADELPRLVPDLPADREPSQGTLRARVRRGASDGRRLGQVMWVTDGLGWRAMVPGQTADGRPDVQYTPREPVELAADLAPLLESGRPTA
jgi:hypothetical protein